MVETELCKRFSLAPWATRALLRTEVRAPAEWWSWQAALLDSWGASFQLQLTMNLAVIGSCTLPGKATVTQLWRRSSPGSGRTPAASSKSVLRYDEPPPILEPHDDETVL
jgi:hypothetical protein